METIITAIEMFNGAKGAVLQITAPRAVADEINKIIPKINGGQKYDLTIKQHREKRSLDSNAYFHVLVGKIAEVLHLGLDEVKKNLVLDYGAVAFMVRVPADANLDLIYTYNKFYGDSKGTKEPCKDYEVFKPTHTLDSKEMSRLIEKTVEEAQELGIETKTPQELADLNSLWGQA